MKIFADNYFRTGESLIEEEKLERGTSNKNFLTAEKTLIQIEELDKSSSILSYDLNYSKILLIFILTNFIFLVGFLNILS